MPDVNKACGLSGTSRIDIFRDLAVDELTNMINMDILASISAENYQKFIDFCEQVTAEREQSLSVSCILENDSLEFSINYKE